MPMVTIEEIQEENINQSERVVTVHLIQKHTQLVKRMAKLVMEKTFKENYEGCHEMESGSSSKRGMDIEE